MRELLPGQEVGDGRGRAVLLGIDPGLANTGWGIIEQRGSLYRCLAYGCITTPASQDISARLKTIHDELCTVLTKYRPQCLGIESIYFGSNSKTAFATGQARGAALVACASAGLQVGEYTPTQIKQVVVGTGRASKEQVQYMVRSLLVLDHDPTPDHAADALAAAICHGNLRGMKSLEQAVSQQEAARAAAVSKEGVR